MAKVNPGEMLPQERQRWILDRLRQRGRVVALELAAEFAVSEDSVRRDLRAGEAWLTAQLTDR